MNIEYRKETDLTFIGLHEVGEVTIKFDSLEIQQGREDYPTDLGWMLTGTVDATEIDESFFPQIKLQSAQATLDRIDMSDYYFNVEFDGRVCRDCFITEITYNSLNCLDPDDNSVTVLIRPNFIETIVP